MKNFAFFKKLLSRSVSHVGKGAERASALVALTALLALSACTNPQATTTPAEESNVSSEELTEETANYIGQTVTVRGEVENIVSDIAFLMADDEYFGREGILVINAGGEDFLVPDVGDTQVQVTGEVETFVMSTAADAYGLTLSPELYEDYENKPVVIAQSMALSPDPGEITAEPEKYYNQRIAVKGEIEEVLESGLFTLEDEELFGGEDLLVIPNGVPASTQDGEIVAVTGVLRPYVKADFERDYDLQWDLSVEENVEAEYSQKPVFVADEVYPSAL